MVKARLTFGEAQAAAQAAGWTTQAAYRANWRQVPGLPSAPEQVYPEWRDWRHFLGAGPRFLSLAEATQAVQAHGYRSAADYEQRYREVPGLPSNPDRTYPDFPGWGVFLGTGRTRRGGSPLPFVQARDLARELKLQTPGAYLRQVEQDPRLPTRPDLDAAWRGWQDFLGFMPLTYAGAQQIVQGLGIRNARDYQQRYRESPELPSAPHTAYPEWESWTAFLGDPPPRLLGYEAAARAARQAGITSFRQYAEVYRSIPGLPSTPNKAYAEWRGWRAFLDQRGGKHPHQEQPGVREL